MSSMTSNLLIDEIVPFVLNSKNWRGNPYQVIIAKTHDSRLIGIIKRMGYCLSKSKGENISKYFQASLILNEPWKEVDDRYYCCSYPKLTDVDLPENWKEIISVEEGRTFSLRAAGSCR